MEFLTDIDVWNSDSGNFDTTPKIPFMIMNCVTVLEIDNISVIKLFIWLCKISCAWIWLLKTKAKGSLRVITVEIFGIP